MDQRARKGRVTIRMVAQDAGVSVAAVSKVLRNAYGVSEALRENVMETIERLQYRPSMAARGMRGQTYTVGILLVDIANPFLPEVIRGINETLAPSNYRSMIGIGNSARIIENSLIDSMIDSHMDGLILIAPRITGDIISCYSARMPIVAIGHHNPKATAYDTVNGDDRQGAAIAVQAFIASGRRDVAIAVPSQDDDIPTNVIYQREEGYKDAMAEAGLADHIRVIHLPEDMKALGEKMRDLLAAEDRPDAIFCWSDLQGIPLINEARTFGLKLPEDVAIISYDNTPVAAMPVVDLSSIDQKGAKLGMNAARMLLERIAGRKEARHVLIKPQLVARSSS